MTNGETLRTATKAVHHAYQSASADTGQNSHVSVIAVASGGPGKGAIVSAVTTDVMATDLPDEKIEPAVR